VLDDFSAYLKEKKMNEEISKMMLNMCKKILDSDILDPRLENDYSWPKIWKELHLDIIFTEIERYCYFKFRLYEHKKLLNNVLRETDQGGKLKENTKNEIRELLKTRSSRNFV